MRRDDEDLLRRLALNDELAIQTTLGVSVLDVDSSPLGPKACALVRLAALIALESAAVSYQWGVTAAIAAGASEEEIVGVLVASAPIVGLVRMNAAAAGLAEALELDITEDRATDRGL